MAAGSRAASSQRWDIQHTQIKQDDPVHSIQQHKYFFISIKNCFSNVTPAIFSLYKVEVQEVMMHNDEGVLPILQIAKHPLLKH